jgi:hypothetical protein
MIRFGRIVAALLYRVEIRVCGSDSRRTRAVRFASGTLLRCCSAARQTLVQILLLQLPARAQAMQKKHAATPRLHQWDDKIQPALDAPARQ